MKYKYLRGSKDSREVFEFDISKRGQYITTCVVDVDLLLCGIKTFPCGNGDDFKLTGQQQLDILELVAAERRKITSGIEIKTMESWYGSGLNFEDYYHPVIGFDEKQGAHCTYDKDVWHKRIRIYDSTPACGQFRPRTWCRPESCHTCSLCHGRMDDGSFLCSGWPFYKKEGDTPCQNGQAKLGEQLKLF